MQPRTIVLLSAKRSGSTAVFRMFQRHPDVGIPHPDGAEIDNWEPAFWSFAAEAIAGEGDRFHERYPATHPVVRGRVPKCEAEAFALWDEIAEAYGPVVFDKSPQYIASEGGLRLLERYTESGANVTLLGLVRDPRDVICSQYELWHEYVESDSPRRREALWVQGFQRLLELRRRHPLLLVRYEDLARSPACYAPGMLAFAGLADHPAAYRHLRPVHVGRHRGPSHPDLLEWEPGGELRGLMGLLGYHATMPAMSPGAARAPASAPRGRSDPAAAA